MHLATPGPVAKQTLNMSAVGPLPGRSPNAPGHPKANYQADPEHASRGGPCQADPPMHLGTPGPVAKQILNVTAEGPSTSRSPVAPGRPKANCLADPGARMQGRPCQADPPMHLGTPRPINKQIPQHTWPPQGHLPSRPRSCLQRGPCQADAPTHLATPGPIAKQILEHACRAPLPSRSPNAPGHLKAN